MCRQKATFTIRRMFLLHPRQGIRKGIGILGRALFVLKTCPDGPTPPATQKEINSHIDQSISQSDYLFRSVYSLQVTCI